MQKTEYLEHKKSFLNEIKSIFHKFWRAIIWWEIEIWQKIADTSFNWSKKSICKFKINNWPTESCGVEKRIDQSVFLKKLLKEDLKRMFLDYHPKHDGVLYGLQYYLSEVRYRSFKVESERVIKAK